jgi:hypothetical protein
VVPRNSLSSFRDERLFLFRGRKKAWEKSVLW